jgi:hypothetical protein
MDFYSHKPLANEVAAISRMGQADKTRGITGGGGEGGTRNAIWLAE